jgi:POT family proton-dependent oligopeptide transporter
MPAYKYVFIAAGIGMLISLVWFWLGRGQLKGVGEAAGRRRTASASHRRRVRRALRAAIPVVYFLLALGAEQLQAS